MKLVLPNSDIPGYKKKIQEELSRLIKYHDNCTRLESYVETNGKMNPELSGLYEAIVNMSISNVELNYKMTVNANKEEIKSNMLRQRPNYRKNMSVLQEIDLEGGGGGGEGGGGGGGGEGGGGGGGGEGGDEEWCVII